MTHQSAAPSNDSSVPVCPLCGRRTRRISVGEAASLAGVSTLTIRRYIEAGIHRSGQNRRMAHRQNDLARLPRMLVKSAVVKFDGLKTNFAARKIKCDK